MKLKALSIAVLLSSAFAANAELIQHTDQIGEVQFTGSTYELGKHVGEVAGDQVEDAIKRFSDTLGVMLPGLSAESLSKSFDNQEVFAKLQKASPESASYIRGLADELNMNPNLLLAVAMSDEAILESQRNGGMGFLQAEKPAHDASAPAKCTSMAVAASGSKAWAASNFDYMGVNYEGLLMLKHTDTDGKTRLIQTWAGLIPYGGVTKGAQVMTMNTMADQGTLREKDGGEILSDTATPSFYLSWDVYNEDSYEGIKSVFDKYLEYTAFFTYTVASANKPAMNIENTYGGKVNYSEGEYKAHANHSIYGEPADFVDEAFAAHSLARQEAVNHFMKNASIDTSEEEVRGLLQSKPLWKGRGEMMGTVTNTYYKIDGKKVDVYFQTDNDHAPVHMSNY
ncbi:C45 family autoproteolytic acyltransferase/hydolase [Vibrio sp. HN007]|uniref:C45 family autoproteolytic acyltransferase/hydolase n=1 Tax=Vibrio iocasae TaxID=3098914 RepID=UPI0035D446BC